MQPLRTRTPSPSPPSSSQHFPPGTTRPSPPRFHLHPAQPPPPPPKQPWAHGATAARGALNLEGRVQHIARPTHTPPPSLLLPGRPQTKDWAWVLRALTRAKRGDGTVRPSPYTYACLSGAGRCVDDCLLTNALDTFRTFTKRCYLNLPHTVLLTGGAAHGCWAFTSAQRGVVLRKHEAHATDLAHLQAEFLRAAAASPRPRLAVPRPRGSEGFGGFASSRSFSSASLSLPAPLAQMGVEPEAVVALAQSEVGGSGAQQQRPIDALELLQMCQSGAFPPGARTLQAFVPEKGASVALVGSVGGGSGGAAASSASSGGEGVQTLVPGSTFQHEYSLGRLGAPLHRTSRCVSRSLFGGRGGPGPGGPAARKGEQVGPAAAATAAGAAADEEEGEALDGEGRGAATTRAGSSLSSWDRRSALELELELLPSTNRALNQAMADAALQVVMYVSTYSIRICAFSL